MGALAEQAAWDRARRPKRCKLARDAALARIVADKLRLEWSPYQVAGWLKCAYPQDETRQVSHETIYRTLFIQPRGALKKELLQHLRRTRGMRRSRHHTQKTPDHGRITETVSIRERPAEAEDREVPGHWEGDLYFGSRNSQIATLVERQTHYVMPVKAASKDSETVVDALIEKAHKLPRELFYRGRHSPWRHRQSVLANVLRRSVESAAVMRHSSARPQRSRNASPR